MYLEQLSDEIIEYRLHTVKRAYEFTHKPAKKKSYYQQYMALLKEQERRQKSPGNFSPKTKKAAPLRERPFSPKKQ